MRSRVLVPFILPLALLPAVFAQTQLIQNGEFASFPSYAPWVLGGSAGITIATGPNLNGGYPYVGAQYLSMGNFAGATQYAYQAVTFPTNLIGATLSVDYQTVSANTLGDDYLYFEIVDTNNNLLSEQLAYTDSAYRTTGYINYTTNFVTYQGSNLLSSLAGQTVEVYFYVTTDSTSGSSTSFDIGDVSLLAGTPADIQPDDNFTNATPILTAGITTNVNTVYASKEPGEPNHAGNAGGHSVWWTWTAPAIGTVTINTTGSSFDTLLAVYTNSTLTNVALTNLACVSSNNGATRSSGLASLKFTVPTPAQVGTTYYIALDGDNGQAGNAVLNFNFALDTSAPTVAISSPANEAVVASSSILVTGTANDNVAVASVQYTLANADGTNAWQLATTTNQWTNWSATVTNLIPGTNKVTVEAFDTSTNRSALVSRVLNYEIAAPLTLSTIGGGTISGATNRQLLDLGFSYTITAKTNGGFAFTGWTGSIVTNSATLSFIMAANLSFTANFVDVQKPTLSITAPAPNQRWSNSVFQIAGKANDNVAVSNVFYQFDSTNWTLATPSNITWSNWTANVTLTPGLNTVRAYAQDTSGNISTNTNYISFFYVVTAPLVVQTNGKGTISPDYNGQSLAIGSNYSMTATATTAAGFAFTNWTGGTNPPFSVLTNNAKLNFTMETNLTLIANFVDVTPPSLTITSPTANQRWSNSIFTATGTAKDNVQVSNVFCQLNSNGWTPAKTGNSTWTNWTATLTPLQSTNVFLAYAVDTSGNKSPTNKVTFFYIPSATLTVQTNGLGSITPVDNGKLLAIGTNYTLTASPAKNWLFSNWVGGTTLPYPELSKSSNYTFPMKSNLVIEANFVTNPFLAVAGVYNGLFYPSNGVTETSSGFISATIASNSTGAYTAKLLLDGGSNSFSGSFDLTGTARTNLARSSKTPVSVTLSLDFNPADALLGGSVSNITTNVSAGWNSMIQADRAIFNRTAYPATNYAGQFTLLLPPGTNAPVGSPAGYGYAAITNTLDGISTLGGALADGTPFLWSAPMARNGGVPLYQSLYSGKGSLLGWIYFTNEPAQNVSTNSSVSWIKPSVSNTLYPSGFTNLTGVLGSPYTNMTKEGVPILNLTSATLILTNGNLANGCLIYTNIGTNLSSHNTLTNLAKGTNLGVTNYLVLAVNTNNGLVTVTFQPTGVKTNIVAHGAVLQNRTNAQGYFLGTNQSGAFLLENP